MGMDGLGSGGFLVFWSFEGCGSMDGEQGEDLGCGVWEVWVGSRGIFWEGGDLDRRFGMELSCGW